MCFFLYDEGTSDADDTRTSYPSAGKESKASIEAPAGKLRFEGLGT